MAQFFEWMNGNTGVSALIFLLLIFFMKREVKKFDVIPESIESLKTGLSNRFDEFETSFNTKFETLGGKVTGIHERVLKIEFELPNLKEVEKSILSANEGKALWSRIDAIKKDIKLIREREHSLANTLTELKIKYELPKWREGGS